VDTPENLLAGLGEIKGVRKIEVVGQN
jgi:hypothetical protein